VRKPRTLGGQRVAADAATRPGTAARAAASKSPGHAIAGVGFYVWDEDPRRALEWAHELAGPRARRPWGPGPR